MLEKAVELGKVNLAEDDPDVLVTAYELGTILQRVDDPMAARRVLEETYAAGLWRLGESDALMLRISHDIGVVAEELGNRHEARKAFTRVAELGPGVLGDGDPAVARARSYLGPGAGEMAAGADFVRTEEPVPEQRVWGGSEVAPVRAAPAEPQARPHVPGQGRGPLDEPTIVQPIVSSPVAEPQAAYRQATYPQVAHPPVTSPLPAYPPGASAAPGGASEGYAGEFGGPWVPAQRQGGGAVDVASGGGSPAYGKKGLGIFAAIAAVLAAVIAVAALVFVLANRTGDPGGDPDVPTLGGPAPTDVRLRDGGASIIVSWTDPSAGSVSFMVTMGRPGQELKPVSTLGPGQTSFEMSGLNGELNYCFAVVAVYRDNQFATSPQACTSRATATPR
ncbi:hypothetical protein [Actinoplanes sp. NPDC048796]|uniref:hypothetical protein n=1 Tax=Actinoplanes sp. NPDC048796 TaxID=3155640 RepID=UPI0033FD454B